MQALAPFLQDEFVSMVEKGQWYVLPYQVAWRLPVLQLGTSGVKVERGRILLWLCIYSFKNINTNDIPLVHLSVMQYGRALD